MLLALEIVRGTRKLCGPDFIITYTLTDDDFVPGGIDPEDSVAFAKALEREGISFLDIKINGTYETFHLEEAPGHLRRQKKGQFDLTEKYKKELSIPVGTSACGEYDPAVNDDAIKKGIVDMVLFGRQTLADPAYFTKVLEGRPEDVRPCIRCIDCMFNGVARIWNVSCSVNTGVGRGERPVVRAPAPKKVLVIGGGPGGLEASRVAALRGHNVTLVEKNATLGGNMAIASLPIAKEVFMSFIEWAERECKKLGVKIDLNKELSAEDIQELNPDAVVVATGSRPLIPPLPGADKSHVVTAEDVLAGKAAVGEKVVVAGGDMVGIETADFIVEKGLAKDVTVVEMLPDILRSENPLDRAHWFAAVLPKIDLKIFTNTRVEEITDEGVIAIDKDWKRHRFEADTVVLAVGYSANRTLYDELKDKVENLCIIGDAKAVRKVENAVHEAFLLAQQI
jgi:2-enoate reductase